MNAKDNIAIIEEKKLELETEKLSMEIIDLESNKKRRWIITISLIIGLLGSSFSAVSTLSSMSLAYKAEAFRSQMQTTELFIKQIIPAIKNDDHSSQQAARKGAYFAAVSLANKFPNLYEPVFVVLESNSKNGDTDAKSALAKLKINNGG